MGLNSVRVLIAVPTHPPVMDNTAFKEALQQYPYLWVGIAAGALAILWLLWLWFSRKACRQKNILAIGNDLGTTRINRRAIAQMVLSACEPIEAITVSMVRVCIHRDSLRIALRLELINKGQLPEIVSTLQQYLNRIFRESLGLYQLGSIDILITHIRPGFLERIPSLSRETAPQKTEGIAERQSE